MTAQTRIRDLELVVALYEEGNLTQAAKRFGITEPAFSKQLKKIERRIQACLFERSNGGVVPTDQGRSFVTHAIDSIQAFRRAVHDAHESKYGEQHKLRIGVSSFLSSAWIELMCSVEPRSYRDLSIEVVGGYSLDLLSQLQHHLLDLVLITNPPRHPTITAICLASDPFMIVMRHKHPLSARESVHLSDVAQYPWVFFNRNIHTRLYDQILRRMESEHYSARLLHRIGHADQASALLLDDTLLAWLGPAGAERIVSNDLISIPLHDPEIRLETYLTALANNKSLLVSEYERSLVKRVEEQRPPIQLKLIHAVG